MTERIIIKIERSKWRSGGYTGDHPSGEGDTCLLNREGYMCCLGFISKANGLEDEVLLDKISPGTIKHLVPELNTPSGEICLPFRSSRLAAKAMELNDNEEITRPGRERALAKLFEEESSYTLEFIGEY